MFLKTVKKKCMVVLLLIIPGLSFAESWTCEGNGTVSTWDRNNNKRERSISLSIDINREVGKMPFAEITVHDLYGNPEYDLVLQGRRDYYTGQAESTNMAGNFNTIMLTFNLRELTFDYKGYIGHPRSGDIFDTHILQVASGTCSKDDE